MRHTINSLFGLILCLACFACQQNTSSSTASTATDESSAEADSLAAFRPGKDAVVVYTPDNQVFGTWEDVGEHYRIFCGGNRFEGVDVSTGYRGIMLNDFSQIYTMVEKDNGFKVFETTSDRLLWDVTLEDTRVTFINGFLETPAIIDFSNVQQPKAIYNDQALGMLIYKDGIHLMSTPVGQVVIRDQPYSKAYAILALGIVIAPPYQMILLKELIDRGV